MLWAWVHSCSTELGFHYRVFRSVSLLLLSLKGPLVSPKQPESPPEQRGPPEGKLAQPQYRLASHSTGTFLPPNQQGTSVTSKQHILRQGQTSWHPAPQFTSF